MPLTKTETALSQPIIQLIEVSKTYSTHGVQALNEISLTIEPGEVVAFMGESGCGKSTLLNIMGGIDRIDTGTIRLLGQEITHSTDAQLTELRREKLGFVFQFFNLLSTLTVAENVALPLELAGRDSAETVFKKVATLLSQVDLSERAHFYPAQLSGGQMQRVAIARALVHEPQIVLADEPTGNLDSKNGQRILKLLTNYCHKHQQTLLIATHSRAAAHYADRVIQMRDGRIESIDPSNTPTGTFA